MLDIKRGQPFLHVQVQTVERNTTAKDHIKAYPASERMKLVRASSNLWLPSWPNSCRQMSSKPPSAYVKYLYIYVLIQYNISPFSGPSICEILLYAGHFVVRFGSASKFHPLCGIPTHECGIFQISAFRSQKFPSKPFSLVETPESMAHPPMRACGKRVSWHLRRMGGPCTKMPLGCMGGNPPGSNLSVQKFLRPAGHNRTDPNAWAKSSLGAEFEANATSRTHIRQASMTG